jgi:hypothetical protein
MAKVIGRVVYENKPWKPLSPKWAVIQGSTIYVKFYVPVGPLVLDTTSLTDSAVPGAKFGFEYFDSSGAPPTVSAVSIVGSAQDTVQITLSAAPTSTTGRQIRYAYTQGDGQSTQPGGSIRGNLRDSDSTASIFGRPWLWNWCCHFALSV